ncbi:MAG: hypothetical protein Q8O52_01655 [Sulfuritalea sp.]|nr:hypothetical protein [Sulfuritalea sp.]
MTTISFPACAIYVGRAVDPSDSTAGLGKAVAAVGEARVRVIVERLADYDGRRLDDVVGELASGWHSSAPMIPALKVLREAGPLTAMAAVAARLLAGKDGNTFSLNGLNALAPAVRALAGLPSVAEVDAAMAA